jgi:hypothetical protein
MISAWGLYWVLRLDEIKGILLYFGIIGTLILSIITAITVVYFMENYNYEDIKKICLSYLRKLVPMLTFTVLLILMSTFIPTTKQMATILILPKIINSEFVQENIPKETQELYSMAKEYLKNQIETTVKENEK